MYAVINTFRKDDIKDEIVYTLIDAKNLDKFLTTDMDINFSNGKEHGMICIFDNIDEAERCMGSK